MILLTEIVVDKLEEGMEDLDKAGWLVENIVLPLAEAMANDLWFLPKCLFTIAGVLMLAGVIFAFFKGR